MQLVPFAGCITVQAVMPGHARTVLHLLRGMSQGALLHIHLIAWPAIPMLAQADDSGACPAAGFVSYEEFQSQALGLGAAVSAVTMLFWVAVLLLVSRTRSGQHST